MFQLTDTMFREKMNIGKPMTLLVSAEWCGPCRSIKNIIPKLETAYKDRVGFYSIDSDSTQELCADLHITAIPTLIFIVGSIEKGRLVGVRSENEIKVKIEELLL